MNPLFRSSVIGLIALLASTVVSGATLHGRVVSIADGDTITILDAQHQQHKIRLQGIDAPESRQSFGKLSKHNLSTLVFGHDVTVEYFKLDRYGRAVGKVMIGDLDANLSQVRAGLAWVYTDYENELTANDRIEYHAAERKAHALRAGFWSEPNPLPPWLFRRQSHLTRSEPTHRNAVELAITPDVAGTVIGNRRSHIFHRPDCPDYFKIAAHNRVPFASAADAEAAGYRQARNCP
jgi:endonuclease YncB( thermonuclease family)